MMSLRVIDSSFGSIRKWTFFSIVAPKELARDSFLF